MNSTDDAGHPEAISPFIPYWLEQCGLSANQYRVVCHLWSRGQGRCFPSMETIAACCRLNLKTVKKTIRELEEMNLIKRQKRKCAGIRNANEYVLNGPNGAPIKTRQGESVKSKTAQREPLPNGPNGAPYKRPKGSPKKGPSRNGPSEKEKYVTDSASAEIVQSPIPTDAGSVSGILSLEEARACALKIREKEMKADPYGDFVVHPEKDIEDLAADWHVRAERTGWIIDGAPIRNVEATLHGYLRKAVKRKSKKFKELAGASSNDGEPPF